MSIAATAPLARVALARSPSRMLAPAIAIVLGGAALGLAAVVVDGAPQIALVVAGAIAMAIGLWLALRVMTLRLLIEPGYLHLRGLGTDRRYQLARGSLARLPTAGPRKVSLAVRLGSLGWTVGRATLPSGERVHVIRLGTTRSLILVPTEQGRVALAVASEAPFVDALVAAARTRAERQPSAPEPVTAAPMTATQAPATQAPATPAPAIPAPAPIEAISAAAATAAIPAAAPVAALPMPAPEAMRARPLTGIERMYLEDRLARERRAAMAGARDEQAAAGFTASVAGLTPAGARAAPIFPAPVVPAAPAAPAPVVAAAVAPVTPLTLASVVTAQPGALPRVIPRRRPLRPMARRVVRPELTPALVLVSTPLIGSLLSWLLAVVLGAAPGTDGMDPLAAALLLCGPVAALAIYLAYSRWPRLAGLSSVSAMLALLLVSRAVLG